MPFYLQHNNVQYQVCGTFLHSLFVQGAWVPEVRLQVGHITAIANTPVLGLNTGQARLGFIMQTFLEIPPVVHEIFCLQTGFVSKR